MALIDSVEQFYDRLAGDYHLMYADWKSEVMRQGEILDHLIRRYISPAPCAVLDCTCGIGTQAIGLASRNYRVHATDLASAAVERAEQEAKAFGVSIAFDVADVRILEERVSGIFDVVISCDNSLSHLLEDDDLLAAARQIRRRLRKDGILIASIRDYDRVVHERRESRVNEAPLPGIVGSMSVAQPTMPRVFDDVRGRRVVFQIWDWAEDGRSYAVNHIHMKSKDGVWETNCFVTRFRALQRGDLSDLLLRAGFAEVRWLMPEESGYYQPIAIAFNRVR
jgi:SAM-dependent methyltransferase